MRRGVFRQRAIGATALMALLFSSTVQATEAQRPTQAPAWAAPPQSAPTIVVDRAACRWVQRHEPTADVAYKPGVDARGKAVAPADLPGSSGIALPETIEIGITVPLAERFGVPRDALYKAEAYVGTVTLRDGKVLFNGQPINPAAEGELVALCAKQEGGGR